MALATAVTFVLLQGAGIEVANAAAGQDDELTIEGDSAVFLQDQNSIEYVGNVVAFMNGMRISGDRVLVQMSDDRVEQLPPPASRLVFGKTNLTRRRHLRRWRLSFTCRVRPADGRWPSLIKQAMKFAAH